MPYANPTPLFIDFQKSLVGTKVDVPYGLDRPGRQILDLEMIWDDTLFPDDLSGRCILLKLGLTLSMLESSDEKTRIRFVITLEITGPRSHPWLANPRSPAAMRARPPAIGIASVSSNIMGRSSRCFPASCSICGSKPRRGPAARRSRRAHPARTNSAPMYSGWG